MLCGAATNPVASAPVSGTIGDPTSTLVFGNGTYPAVVNGNSVSEMVSARAKGSMERPIFINGKVFQSTSGQNDANQQALELGVIQLDCFWTNNQVTGTMSASMY